MDFGACSGTESSIQRFLVTVYLLHVDTPPVFSVPFFNITTSGVGVAGQSIWQPLSQFVTNPDGVYPYNVTTYRLIQGPCLTQSRSGGDISAPVSIGQSNGSLYYTVAGPLGGYPSPMSLCVLAVDLGGLSASADISLWFSAIQQQLAVLSSTVNVTHYSPGQSTIVVGVAYWPGSLANGNWTVTVSPCGWCGVSYRDSTAMVVQLNSVSLIDAFQPVFTTIAIISSLGELLRLHSVSVHPDESVFVFMLRRWFPVYCFANRIAVSLCICFVIFNIDPPADSAAINCHNDAHAIQRWPW